MFVGWSQSNLFFREGGTFNIFCFERDSFQYNLTQFRLFFPLCLPYLLTCSWLRTELGYMRKPHGSLVFLQKTEWAGSEKVWDTWIFWEADGQRALLDLFLKQILLVQEQNNGCVCEPLVVANWIEQFQRLVHSILKRQIAEKNILQTLTVVSSSCNTWSYSDMATQKMMAVTSSKQWIHFFLSDLWPPTSNNLQRSWVEIRKNSWRTHLKLRFLNVKWTSTIPVVLTRVRRISCSVGWYEASPNRSRSSRKLQIFVSSQLRKHVVFERMMTEFKMKLVFRALCFLFFSLYSENWHCERKFRNAGGHCPNFLMNSLFSGIVQLVFVAPRKTVLYSCIGPQPLHRTEQLLRERFRVLHTCHNIHH